MSENIKLVVVGDEGVGKTCLLISYACGAFPDEYIPTVFDNYNHKLIYEEKEVTLGLWDTSGADKYADRLRPLNYPMTDVFFVLFSLDDIVSLQNVENKWIPEIEEHAPGVPIYLIGTKLDLKHDFDDKRKKEFDEEEGKKKSFSLFRKKKKFESIGVLATEIARKNRSLMGYEECSAKTQKNLKQVFQLAFAAVFHCPVK